VPFVQLEMNDSELERSQRATVEREQEKLQGTGTARSRSYIQEHEHEYAHEHEHAPRAFTKEEDAPRRYSQIEDYGAIGNLRTAALISKQGSIDWFCFPHFDSPSIFGALLDAVKGGYFRIAPRNLDACRLQQMYMPDTNVLVSRFLSEEGVCQVTDFMPLSSRQEDIHPWLLREVVCVRGTTQIEVECFPAFEYGTATHSVSIVEPVGLEEYEAQLLRLKSNVKQCTRARFWLEPSQQERRHLSITNEASARLPLRSVVTSRATLLPLPFPHTTHLFPLLHNQSQCC